MTKFVKQTVASIFLGVFALGSAAEAQQAARTIQATIPFEFSVGSRTLPAGSYRLLSRAPGFLEVRDMTGRTLAEVATYPVQSSKTPARPKVEFVKTGGHYALTQVWQESYSTGERLRPPSTKICEAPIGPDSNHRCQRLAIRRIMTLTKGGHHEHRHERKQWTTQAADLHVQEVIRSAEHELQELLQRRAELMKRIGTIKQTLAGLANIFGDSVLSDQLLTFLDRKSVSRQPGFTRACRVVLMESGRPLGRPVCLSGLEAEIPGTDRTP